MKQQRNVSCVGISFNMKRLFILMVVLIGISGCSFTKEEVNKDSQLAKIKDVMTNHLDNFSYTAKITTKTGIVDVATTMSCKEDRKNKIGYCSTSTYGVNTEEYYDYGNGKAYTKVYSPYSSDASNGKWTSTSVKNSNTNSWLNLNNYIFDIKEEMQGSNTLYTGTISSEKLAAAMAQADSSIDTSKIVSNDINISILVNSSNYIEKMNFEMEIMGISEVVEINYSNYNNSGSITIPAEAK